LPLRFSLMFICPSDVLRFPITIFQCKCRSFSLFIPYCSH
jgi:hypothetical protein